MSTATPLITYEEFLELEPENGEKIEFIEGEVLRTVSPSVERQRIARNIQRFLVEKLGWDRIWTDRTGYYLGNVELQPDLSHSYLEQAIENGTFVGTPLLAVEVLTPSSKEVDTKISLYVRHFAKEVWIVNSTLRLLVVYTNGARTEIDSEYRSEALGLTITLADIFGA